MSVLVLSSLKIACVLSTIRWVGPHGQKRSPGHFVSYLWLGTGSYVKRDMYTSIGSILQKEYKKCMTILPCLYLAWECINTTHKICLTNAKTTWANCTEREHPVKPEALWQIAPIFPLWWTIKYFYSIHLKVSFSCFSNTKHHPFL